MSAAAGWQHGRGWGWVWGDADERGVAAARWLVEEKGAILELPPVLWETLKDRGLVDAAAPNPRFVAQPQPPATLDE